MKIFVADNPDEVRKFEAYRDQAELLLRVSFRSPGAVCDLSRKFGCDPEDLLELARLARKLAIPVRGLSFHVGSQAADAGKHVEAIEVCAQAHGRRRRREKLGVFDTLDIGGGYPIDYGQKVAGHRPLLRADPRRAGQTTRAPARHRRARPLHLRPRRHRRGLGHGPRASAKATGGTTSTTACTARTAASCSITRSIRSSR